LQGHAFRFLTIQAEIISRAEWLTSQLAKKIYSRDSLSQRGFPGSLAHRTVAAATITGPHVGMIRYASLIEEISP